MARITDEDIVLINDLYLELGSYAAVARKTGRAPSTVKKYIIADYKRREDIIETKFDMNKLKDIESYVPVEFINNEEALMHTEEEALEIVTFREELVI